MQANDCSRREYQLVVPRPSASDPILHRSFRRNSALGTESFDRLADGSVEPRNAEQSDECERSDLVQQDRHTRGYRLAGKSLLTKDCSTAPCNPVTPPATSTKMGTNLITEIDEYCYWTLVP